jgi:hypothetical protein
LDLKGKVNAAASLPDGAQENEAEKRRVHVLLVHLFLSFLRPIEEEVIDDMIMILARFSARSPARVVEHNAERVPRVAAPRPSAEVAVVFHISRAYTLVRLLLLFRRTLVSHSTRNPIPSPLSCSRILLRPL